MLTTHDVPSLALFRFARPVQLRDGAGGWVTGPSPAIFVSLGSGWYGSEHGFDGGPWGGWVAEGREVELVYGPAWVHPEDRPSLR